MGSFDLVPDAQQTSPSVQTDQVHTGTYAGALADYTGEIYWNLASTETDVYVSLWLWKPSSFKIEFVLASGEVISFITDGLYYFDAYVDGGEAAGGNVAHPSTGWFHFECRASIANAGGRLQSWTDGLADIDYTGDTQPGASDTIESVRLSVTGDVDTRFDDLHINNARIYDRRVLGAVVTSDDTAQLTASSGGDNYADVDELGPDDDTTYVSTDTDAQKDLYGHGGVDLSNYTTPFWVTVWARVRKTVANGDQLRLLLESNGTEDQGDFEDMYTTYEGYLQKLWENDPDTAAAWANEAAIDAALIGIESNIP
jgi:hypothetical protein